MLKFYIPSKWKALSKGKHTMRSGKGLKVSNNKFLTNKLWEAKCKCDATRNFQQLLQNQKAHKYLIFVCIINLRKFQAHVRFSESQSFIMCHCFSQPSICNFTIEPFDTVIEVSRILRRTLGMYNKRSVDQRESFKLHLCSEYWKWSHRFIKIWGNL